MKLIITDTNVFFDIISIDILPEFFALDFEICTTDFVVKEVLESTQKEQIESFIRANRLNVFKFTEDEVEESQLLLTWYFSKFSHFEQVKESLSNRPSKS